ncbi:MAG: LysE family translocator [Dysgonamonadaceae bacterium]|nr:LysE family translocator [Dysgonamonadaceae bacterium]
MGPIGLLCIQRTLNKGRWHGLCSGIGAALSDLVYAIITCLGMGYVIDFVEDNKSILLLIGSFLLLFFGYYIYRSNPSKNLRKSKETVNTYHQDTVTAFLLALSNPLIIFLFIALFARFNFISPDENETLFSMILGLSAVVIGAFSWWFLITFLVGKLRKNFNLRGLWIMNRIVGIAIIFLSIAGVISSIWDMTRLHYSIMFITL